MLIGESQNRRTSKQCHNGSLEMPMVRHCIGLLDACFTEMERERIRPYLHNGEELLNELVCFIQALLQELEHNPEILGYKRRSPGMLTTKESKPCNWRWSKMETSGEDNQGERPSQAQFFKSENDLI